MELLLKEDNGFFPLIDRWGRGRGLLPLLVLA